MTPAAKAPAPRNPSRQAARQRRWCEWEDFDRANTAARQAVHDPAGAPGSPFDLLAVPGASAADQQASAERWMRARLIAAAPQRDRLGPPGGAAPGRAQPARPLRLAYLSNDFHQHATALLMVEMLEAHDASHFELHAYSYGGDDGHGMRQRLQRCFEHFTDISALDDFEAARQMQADGIDILIDLKGYTAGTRTALLGLRPAPVQVSFLGYPGTLGPGLADYLVSDRFVTPAGAAADYSEALACLPHSYQPHGRAGALAAAPPRAAAGLPDDALVLCCFNQAWKFTPEVFDIWCALLREHPHAVLWLLADARAEGNLRNEALQRGVLPQRLVFAPDAPQAEHLARLPLADLVLDTSPYNAHTTASDALWAGVPLLTCAGQTFASRVAGSLLHAVGLPELVTYRLADYAALARALVADRPRLRALRAKLAGQREAAPLFDVPRYTRDLEALYTAMWARHAAGLPPQAIDAPGAARP